MQTKDQHPQIVLNEIAIEHLRVARKWSNFLSIIGFVVIGIMIIVIVGTFFLGLRLPHETLFRWTVLLQIVPLAIIAVIYGIPIYYLYKFGKHSKVAIENNDSAAITIALQYLKLHYRFMGILVIVVLLGYLVAIIVILMAFPFVSSMMHR